MKPKPDPAILAKQPIDQPAQRSGGPLRPPLAKQPSTRKRKLPKKTAAELHALRIELGKRRAKTLTPMERWKGAWHGGRERANKLAPDIRKRIARDAARARWGK